MLANLALGTALSAVTLLVHAVGLIALTRLIGAVFDRLPSETSPLLKIILITVVGSGVFVLLGAEIALWAVCLLALDVFADFETALYFSTSSFSTIGFGDVSPAREWRLLASMEGVVGFLIVGWSSAYLVTSGIRYGPFERDKHF